MVSTKEKQLIAIALYWRRMFEKTQTHVVAHPTIEWMLDEICNKAGLTLSVKERNEVLSEYCKKYQQTI
jgi:hypothetical protein